MKTDRLQRNRDLNIGVPTPRPTDPAQRPIFPARPLSTLGSVQIRESTAKSEYTAFTLSSRLRRDWGLFNVNYVLSKSMSDDDNERDSGGVRDENTFNLGPEWGPARLDCRHQFNGYAVFFLPYDFDVSTGFKFMSGLPIDATIGRDINAASAAPIAVQRAGPAVPAQRRSATSRSRKSTSARSGVPIQRRQPRAGHGRSVQRVQLGQHPASGSAARRSRTTAPAPRPTTAASARRRIPNFLQVKDPNGNYITTNIPGAPRQVQLGVRFEF